MFRQIRSLLSEPDMQLEGSTVEVDEMYHGGKRKNGRGRPMRGDKQKTPVLGVVERKGGRVIARTAPDVTMSTLQGFVKEFVLPKSTVFTDEFASYNGLDRIDRARNTRTSASITNPRCMSWVTFTPTLLKDSGV